MHFILVCFMVVKLVRDKIPEIIKESGKIPFYYFADTIEYSKLLRQKLKEEVAEFIESEDIEEMGDILEVLNAICIEKGLKFESVEKIRAKKARIKGRFSKKIILE